MQSPFVRRSRDLPTSILAATTLLTVPALAQDTGSAAAPEERVLETIVVTAQEREQNLQDVPIVVTAIPQQTARGHRRARYSRPVVGDALAGRLFAAWRERDGFYDVRVGAGPSDLREDQTRNYYTVRGQLLWEASDRLDLLVIGDF
jgi:outer membrane receptor protein involved in Fe transport